MSITGKQFYDKIRGLRPDLSSGISSEILSKVYDDSSTQPFLEWFCKNVSSANVLSIEEMKLKNTLQNADEWLEDEALEAALEEATRECPDLLQLVGLDDTYKDLLAEYETLKESCRNSEEYLQTLKDGIKNLKDIENKLDDDIEEAEIMLDKEQIETEKAYDDCSVILKEFDKNNCQFSKDVDNLLNIYADAARNQSDPVLWSQMPIDLFIKQVELYNQYLDIYIKKQFDGINKSKKEQEEDSDYASLINDSREKQLNERMYMLSFCKTSLINSKTKEININIQEEFYMTMLQCAQDIYNDSVLKVPEDSKLYDEIQTLTTKRDFLEHNFELLRDQQFFEVQFAEMEILKILKNDALARFERRKTRLNKLKNLYSFAVTHGHVYVDLLCMLMETQFCSLREVAEFIADARHYITTEYKLSSTRCEVMQQQQDEYATLVTQSLKTYNVFNQIFISMMLGNDVSDESLSSALKKYDDLIADNVEKKKFILETHINDEIDELQKLEDEVNKDYVAEIRSGSTVSFNPIISYEINNKCEEISTIVQEMQGDLIRIRNQFKERMRMDINLKREKDILWQRFLAEPDTLRMKYKEAEQKANESHFGYVVENKVNP